MNDTEEYLQECVRKTMQAFMSLKVSFFFLFRNYCNLILLKKTHKANTKIFLKKKLMINRADHTFEMR